MMNLPGDGEEIKSVQSIYIYIYMGKAQVKFLRLGTLGSLIEFKHMIALTNETQIMLSFPRIFKFNVFEFNQEHNILDISNCT